MITLGSHSGHSGHTRVTLGSRRITLGSHSGHTRVIVSGRSRVKPRHCVRSRAANRSDLDVEAALEGIVLDFQEYLIPDTSLVDYGPAMDVWFSLLCCA